MPLAAVHIAAAEVTRNAYGAARDNQDQARRDMQLGRDRAQQRARDAQTRIQDGPGGTSSGARLAT